MVAPTNGGYVVYPPKSEKPGYPRSLQQHVDPDSLDLGPLGAGKGQLIPNPDYGTTHDVVPGAPNAYDWLGQDVGGRVLQTGAPNINPFAGIQQVGDVVPFPMYSVRDQTQAGRDLRGTAARNMGYLPPWVPYLPELPAQVIRINPFARPRQ